jgi:hypothetical protein
VEQPEQGRVVLALEFEGHLETTWSNMVRNGRPCERSFAILLTPFNEPFGGDFVGSHHPTRARALMYGLFDGRDQFVHGYDDFNDVWERLRVDRLDTLCHHATTSTVTSLLSLVIRQ